MAGAEAFLAQVSTRFPDRIRRTDADRLAYARDMWPLGLLWARGGRVPTPPDAVIWPRSEADLVELVQLARKHRVPLIPFGAGSGVCGGTWATQGGVAIDLKGFDDLMPVDRKRRTVEVGAGVLGEVLERRLNAQGFTLGHFPSSIYMSTVGGWLAARSAGQLSSRYGKIEDMVLAARFIDGRGAVRELAVPHGTGIDEVALLIGSEGCFGFFTRATLRVHPMTPARAFRGFEFARVVDGLEAMRRMMQAGLRPSVARLYDPFDTWMNGRHSAGPHAKVAPSLQSIAKRQLRTGLLRGFAKFGISQSRMLNASAEVLKKSLLVLMFEGEADQACADEEAARAICLDMGGTDLGPGPGERWLKKRYDVSFKMSMAIDSAAVADTMEVAAPWTRVHAIYEAVKAAAAPHAFVMCHFSHAYAEGCSLYFTFVASTPSSADLEERYLSLWRAALAAAVGQGATVSHHHGIGLLKAKVYAQSLGDGFDAVRALKAQYDPDGIMNPGKLGL